MPSWQARVAASYVRTVIRRRDWGDERALARRSRRHFGAPLIYRNLVLSGLEHEVINNDRGVRGEWISTPSPTPDVLMYVHGGGYVSCSAATHRTITTALARATGCRIFSADYRIAPEARFPAAFDDVLETYRWLTSLGDAKIALAGESAGGGLVLAVAACAQQAGLPPPACVAALSPWTDLAATGPSVRENDGKCAMFRTENMTDFASVYLKGAPADDPRASPLYADVTAMPPTLLQVGSTELLLDDARRMHERITAAGAQSRLSIYDDVIHGWQLLAPLVPEARAAVNEVASFVREAFTAARAAS